MPRKKTKPQDLPDKKAIEKLFPKEAVKAAREEAKNPRSPAPLSIEKKSK